MLYNEFHMISNSSNPGNIYESICSVHAGLPNNTSSHCSRAGLCCSLCYWCKAPCTMAKKQMNNQKKKKPKLTVDVTAQEFAKIGAGIMNRFPGGSGDDFDTT